MKKLSVLFLSAWGLLLAGCLSGGNPVPAEAIRVGTYNIRLSPGDKGTPNAWMERRADMVACIRNLNLDVFGMQEVCPDQAEYLRQTLPEFAFVGDHRDADRKSGEASPVFYRKSRFDAEDAGTFWLSETPEVPASKSWGTACTRVCSYLILKDRRTGRRFCFANTHTDHISALARKKGMLLIIERMKTFGKCAPIIFTGDHNCNETEDPARAVAQILDNALFLSETPPTGAWRTWNGWRWREPEFSTAEALRLSPAARNPRRGSPDATAGKGPTLYERCGGSRIDYIYVSRGSRVLDYATVDAPRPGKKLYPSDHFPVTATVVLPPE